jgi:hypothetical protein
MRLDRVTARTGDIGRVVGGTETQRRLALARLVKSRKVVRSGEARSTSYSVR